MEDNVVNIDGTEGEMAPAILHGIILYQTTDGQFGMQDMFNQDGGARREASLAVIAALLGTAHDMNLAEVTSHNIIRQQIAKAQSMRPAQQDIVGLDGGKLTSE